MSTTSLLMEGQPELEDSTPVTGLSIPQSPTSKPHGHVAEQLLLPPLKLGSKKRRYPDPLKRERLGHLFSLLKKYTRLPSSTPEAEALSRACLLEWTLIVEEAMADLRTHMKCMRCDADPFATPAKDGAKELATEWKRLEMNDLLEFGSKTEGRIFFALEEKVMDYFWYHERICWGKRGGGL